MEVAVLRHQYDLIDLEVHFIRRRRRRLKYVSRWDHGSEDDDSLTCTTSFWWISETRIKDPSRTSLRMPTEMFDELLARMGPRITKQHTSYREPLEPGLKLALTLRHLASESKYSTMNYAWKVPHNTQSLAVREVYRAIVDEYIIEVMTCHTTPEGRRAISDKFLQKENFPHTCGALNGKHIACKCPPKSGCQFFNYKGFHDVVLMALVDADYKLI